MATTRLWSAGSLATSCLTNRASSRLKWPSASALPGVSGSFAIGSGCRLWQLSSHTRRSVFMLYASALAGSGSSPRRSHSLR